MDSASTLHCVKTCMGNRRTNKPTLDAIQMFAIDIKSLLQRAKVFLKSQNILNYNESM